MADPHAPSTSSASTPQDAAVTTSTKGAAGEQERPREGQLLTTGEMARQSNSTLRTVRFYEEAGILRPARRTDGGHRLFERSELDRLMLVTDMRMAGLSLDDIKAILEVKKTASSGMVAAAEATRVLATRIDELKDKLSVLNRLRDDLEETAKIVSSCRNCSDTKSFPNECASCSVMSVHSVLPRSVRVLWSVGHGSPHERGEQAARLPARPEAPPETPEKAAESGATTDHEQKS